MIRQNINQMRKIFSSVLLTLVTICFLTNQITYNNLFNPTKYIPNEWNKFSVTQSTIPKYPSTDIPVYSVYLSHQPSKRYKKIIQDKKTLLNKFIDYLYQINHFKYSMWIAKTLFYIFPQTTIRNHLGHNFFDECKGIAIHSQRQVYEIIVYNYMYEIGAAKDFCTSIALTQTLNHTIQHKQNLTLLARNLDYGFQTFLASNTLKINFYHNQTQTQPLFTTLTHAGFVSTHTFLKYQTQANIQFALTLNQRKSQNFISTLVNIIFFQCESVFQLINRLSTTDIFTIEQLIEISAKSNSCSKFYFIVQTKDGDHCVIQKNEGVGAHRVYFKKAVDFNDDPFFIVQTNTDREKKDPDGRRDQAIDKMNKVIGDKGYVTKQDTKKILLQPPNFNDQTLMTALIDVEKGQIEAMVWNIQDSSLL